MNSLQILDRLVGFPTISGDSNQALIDFVREFLAARGVASRLYGDVNGTKANLFATIGPPGRGGVLLSGHTDVVSVDGQAWRSDPFRLKESDGRLFARGSADMKGFLACALRAADVASQRQLTTPLHLAFSYDEELGCMGVRSLIADMANWSFLPKFCIVGEPTMLLPAVGHKGKTAIRVVCRGRAAHSARSDLGINSIYMAADWIANMRRRQAEIAATGNRDSAYEVPYTTLHVGVIHGGTALNVVPSCCELEFEIRNLATDAARNIMKTLRTDAETVTASLSDVADAGIEFEITNEYPGLDTRADSEVAELVAAISGNAKRVKLDFGSEAGLFSEGLGIPTVVCGPGSIDQAHSADEYITIDQLNRCDAMLDALLDRLV